MTQMGPQRLIPAIPLPVHEITASASVHMNVHKAGSQIISLQIHHPAGGLLSCTVPDFFDPAVCRQQASLLQNPVLQYDFPVYK